MHVSTELRDIDAALKECDQLVEPSDWYELPCAAKFALNRSINYSVLRFFLRIRFLEFLVSLDQIQRVIASGTIRRDYTRRRNEARSSSCRETYFAGYDLDLICDDTA